MKIDETIEWLYDLKHYIKYDEQAEAMYLAIDALKLKKELIEEIPTFEHILNAQYEIFNKYDLSGSHTDVELIAWNENGRIMQDIQWLLDRLKECEIPKAEPPFAADTNVGDKE